MTEIQIVEAPIGNESEDQVREALVVQYPGYRVAKVEQIEGNWRARLVREGVHHRIAEFPLKPMAPDDEGSEDAPPAAEKPKPKKDKKPKGESIEDAVEDAEDGGSDEAEEGEKPFGDKGDDAEVSADPIARIEKLLRDLQKVVPQLQSLLRGDHGGDMGDMPSPHMDGPPMGGGGPDLGGPPAGPGPGAGGPPRPPRGPAGPGGGGGAFPGGPGGGRPRPGGPRGQGGPSRYQLPTFTNRQTMRLEREANVTEQEAVAELSQEFPGYKVEEITRNGSKFVAKLKIKQ